MSFDRAPLSVGDDAIGSELPTPEEEAAAKRAWDEMTPQERADWEEIERQVDEWMRGLEEAHWEEELHPRGPHGEWVGKGADLFKVKPGSFIADTVGGTWEPDVGEDVEESGTVVTPHARLHLGMGGAESNGLWLQVAYMDAEPKGTGLGTRVVGGLRRWSDATGKPLRFISIENPEFFDHWSDWAEATYHDDPYDGEAWYYPPAEVAEASWKEFLHPRGRGGKWIEKLGDLGGPGQESGEAHPAHGLAEILHGQLGAEAAHRMNEAGYEYAGTVHSERGTEWLYRNHTAGAQIHLTFPPSVDPLNTRVGGVRAEEYPRTPSGAQELAGLSRKEVGQRMREAGFIPMGINTFDDGDWWDLINPDGRGVSMRLTDDDKVGKVIVFPPSAHEVTRARTLATQRDPFRRAKPGENAMPIVNALHTIDSGWSMDASRNRDELPPGSLPEGVEAFTRFNKKGVGSSEPPDSFVIHTRRGEDGELKIVNAGHGSMVWDHIIVSDEQRAEEVRIWKADKETAAREAREREAQAQARLERIDTAVKNADAKTLKDVLGNSTAEAASGLLQGRGLQLREKAAVPNEATRSVYTLRGKHGETVRLTEPPSDSFREMEEAVDRAQRGQLQPQATSQAATDVLKAKGDPYPDRADVYSEASKAWRERRDAEAERLASQHYSWVGRIDTGQENYPNGLWAVVQGDDDGNQYFVNWGGDLRLVTDKPGFSRASADRVIQAPRDDRRLSPDQLGVGVEILPNPQGGKRDRLPEGQAPKRVNELLVDTLGRADELARKYDTGVNVQAVVHDVVNKDAAAVHEWNGTISILPRYLDDADQYLRRRSEGGSPLSDRDHLRFYNDLEILQHEINHGVGVDGGIKPDDYTDLGVNVEEGLTEEVAHLEVADWLRSYGMTDVLAAVERNPRSFEVLGTYPKYRTQIKQLMDQAGLSDEERRAKLREMKFRMTTAEQHAELIRMAKLERPRVSTLGGALGPKPDVTWTDFEPVVRADLSDIDAGITHLLTRGGMPVRANDAVEVVRRFGTRPVKGKVMALRPDESGGTNGWVQVQDRHGNVLWYPVDYVTVTGHVLT